MKQFKQAGQDGPVLLIWLPDKLRELAFQLKRRSSI